MAARADQANDPAVEAISDTEAGIEPAGSLEGYAEGKAWIQEKTTEFAKTFS
jgi:hypothetical protein